MKKIAAILLTVLMFAVVLVSATSCVTRALPNFEIPEEGWLDEEVTITFLHTMGADYRQVLDRYIEEFNKLFPKITIEHKQGGGYNDLVSDLVTLIGNGDPDVPNIAYCYPDHVAEYRDARGVVTLDNLIASDIEIAHADGTTEKLGFTQDQLDDFIPGYYAEGEAFGDGLMYLLPFSKSTEVMYYNKTFFDANKLKVPDHWFAADENDDTSLEYVCRKIKSICNGKGENNVIPLGYDSESNLFITMCEQMGIGYTTNEEGNHFVFNNKEARDMLNKFRGWYQEGLMTTQELNNGAYTSGLFTNVDKPEAARSYISIGSTAGATKQRPNPDSKGNYPFEVGIATIPQMDKNNPKVIQQGPDVCIFKKENPQEVLASWLFVKFLTTNVAFQADFSLVGGYTPVIKSAYEDKILKDVIDKADGGRNVSGLSVKQCRAQVDAYFTSPVFRGSSTARTQVGLLVSDVLQIKSGDIAKQIEEKFANAIAACEYNQ